MGISAGYQARSLLFPALTPADMGVSAEAAAEAYDTFVSPHYPCHPPAICPP